MLVFLPLRLRETIFFDLSSDEEEESLAKHATGAKQNKMLVHSYLGDLCALCEILLLFKALANVLASKRHRNNLAETRSSRRFRNFIVFFLCVSASPRDIFFHLSSDEEEESLAKRRQAE